MSVPGLSASYGYYQIGGQIDAYDRRRQNFEDLSTALASDDLSGAQQALSLLQQGASSSSDDDAGLDGIVADISALGKALQSGDLDSARDAFSELQTDLQSAAPPQPPPPGGGRNDAIGQAFGDLADALQSGDLDAAKDAFATLEELTGDSDSADAGKTDSNPLRDLVNALSDALQSGDLGSAQETFAKLLEELKAGASAQGNQRILQQLQLYTQNKADTDSNNGVSVSA